MDDLNLPEIEEFGTQNALSMLRMIMDLKTFYDREDLSFRKEIVDAVYVSAILMFYYPEFINLLFSK